MNKKEIPISVKIQVKVFYLKMQGKQYFVINTREHK
jgi:hypothetical protein